MFDKIISNSFTLGFATLVRGDTNLFDRESIGELIKLLMQRVKAASKQGSIICKHLGKAAKMQKEMYNFFKCGSLVREDTNQGD